MNEIRTTKKTTDIHKMEIERLTGGKFEFIGEYKNKQTKVKYKCHVCNGEFDDFPSAMLQQFQCKCCRYKVNLLEVFNINNPDDYIREFDKVSNGRYKMVTPYIDADAAIQILDNHCKQILSYNPIRFLINPYCLFCSGGLTYDDTTFKNKLSLVHKGIYKVEGEFTGIKDYVLIHCTSCKKTKPVIAKEVIHTGYKCRCRQRKKGITPPDSVNIAGVVSITLDMYNQLFEKSRLYDEMMENRREEKRK